LAEVAHGPIPRAVDFGYVWGDALAEFDRRGPDFRLINLETAVTCSDRPVPKGINYRVSPANFPCITAAGIDCCTLANNHVLDWGPQGLIETLDTIQRTGILAVGFGWTVREAAAPAILAGPGRTRVVVFAFGSPTSGVPRPYQFVPLVMAITILSAVSNGLPRY
jgi:poly-gamma-glutamate capsule biosynthesis protein CapA/YwtB (metallophosphatase superfamily)